MGHPPMKEGQRYLRPGFNGGHRRQVIRCPAHNPRHIASDQVRRVKDPINVRAIALAGRRPGIHKTDIENRLRLLAARDGVHVAQEHRLRLSIPSVEDCLRLRHTYVGAPFLSFQMRVHDSRFISSTRFLDLAHKHRPEEEIDDGDGEDDGVAQRRLAA